ncbi:triose-phosphate isomerase [Aureitalea marina]|uniref:Triosephosphate isomerase n=1 Tax=Aureitalea marina TaxID=930804 RepID=A0A2S7KMJ9_9FLAO|nr:triose-phosphate isomerase [Aureitalea marina]PQB03793.1 triose-phosphate isomerase [Aureitalea marina]
MRKKIVAGNWKMNNDLQETRSLLEALTSEDLPSEVEVMVAPSFTNLNEAVGLTDKTAIVVAAQNMHQSDKGAFTGEVSAGMLKSIGVETVIIGHSERRAYFGESDRILAEKVRAALVNGMRVIFCFGETLADRKHGEHFETVKTQLTRGLFQIEPGQWKQIVLAYEPVWAIGTGETASPQQAQEMHAYIRETIADAFNGEIAESVSILYGGSVKPGNASEIFGQIDVDGGLIGGASLKAEDFLAIINA